MNLLDQVDPADLPDPGSNGSASAGFHLPLGLLDPEGLMDLRQSAMDPRQSVNVLQLLSVWLNRVQFY